jgi:hypothetical protein
MPGPATRTRRLAQLLITTDLLEWWLKQGAHGFVPTRHHLPDDARLCGAYTYSEGIIALVFASEEFPDHFPADEPGVKPAGLPVLEPIDMRPRHFFDIPLSLN